MARNEEFQEESLSSRVDDNINFVDTHDAINHEDKNHPSKLLKDDLNIYIPLPSDEEALTFGNLNKKIKHAELVFGEKSQKKT